MLPSIILSAVGLGILVTTSSARAVLPELVHSKGRDTSERRVKAMQQLHIMWIARYVGIFTAGAATILLGRILSSDLSVILDISLTTSRITAIIGLAFLFFIIGEIIPVFIAKWNSSFVIVLVRIPYTVIHFLFFLPALIIFGRQRHDDDSADGDMLVTPPDIIWLEQRKEKGEPGEYEKEQELMDSILDFSDKIVREIMIPRIDIISVEINEDLDTIVKRVLKAGHSRIPVYKDKIDNIVGILYVKDLLTLLASGVDSFNLEETIRPGYFVPEYKRIDELFKNFQTQHTHLAIVVDEYGGTAGIVTLEDIIEEVFGEILDEYDEDVSLVKRLENGDYRVGAIIPIDDLNDLLDIDLDDDDCDSLGGILYSEFTRIPHPDESVVLSGYRFTVESVSGQRILFVKITKEDIK